MTPSNSILSPAEHEAFGHWLSGFTDGEGNFHLCRHGKRLKAGKSNGFFASFRIGLRVDDKEILESIQAFLGCGSLYPWINCRGRPNDKPQVRLQIACIPDLAGKVIPHFERFPLRAKKAREFSIWKGAVRRIHAIQQRPRRGRLPRWAPEDAALLATLADQLRRAKQFTDLPAVVPVPAAVIPES